jgi:Ca-activated chloride channel family protein
LLEQLGSNDVISIVTYAGSDKIVADSIPGSERNKLARLIDNLSAGGSTAGAQGIRTAYDLAAKNYIEGGNNRVILATDGDFNVGESSVSALTNLIEAERDRGVFISVLGFGMGNLKDDMMKSIAMSGNGNYAYIDTLQEAKKVLVDDFDSTMFVVAKDVKLQVEFNPETVDSYRLIGYEVRRMENEDFNNDQKDAGDVGSGHSVTAFYELIPAGETEGGGAVDPLKYSQQVANGSDDYMTVKIRYKAPDGDESELIEKAVGWTAYRQEDSTNFTFASAVAEFGLIITHSDYKGYSSVSNVLSRAAKGLGLDAFGLRAEFIELVQAYYQIID